MSMTSKLFDDEITHFFITRSRLNEKAAAEAHIAIDFLLKFCFVCLFQSNDLYAVKSIVCIDPGSFTRLGKNFGRISPYLRL